MRLSISHTSRYRFDQPVSHALQRLRLTPKATQGQVIHDWQMDFTSAAQELEYEDQHHNHVTLVALEPGATEVVITCRGVVETNDKAGVIGRHAGHLPLWSFVGQTDLTRAGPRLRYLVRGLEAPDRSRLDFLHALSDEIRRQVVYATGTTGVTTTAEQALEAATGVCQDHSHIFIAAARMSGIPARYVSGYLMMNDRIEQEATHAWAEAHVDGLGWVGFDVSNGISPDTRYVRVATGRDYRDAAPITGISYGAATEDLNVTVAVEQQQQQQ
jgi:transglutaminase-like putative cysteine protease